MNTELTDRDTESNMQEASSMQEARSPKFERKLKRKTFIQKWRIRWFALRYRIYPKRCRIRQYYNDNEVYVEFRTWGKWEKWSRPMGVKLTFIDVEEALRSIRTCPHKFWRVTIRLAHPDVNSTDQRFY